ncbi:hypothetical protein CP10743SC13_0829A, partial [Chlamydia psittaci 10_743_SC13]
MRSISCIYRKYYELYVKSFF